MKNSTWIETLKAKKLTRTDMELVKRYEENPQGKGFVGVSECLFKHGFEKESIELLIQGVKSFPDYTLARVILVRELFKRGMILDAWFHLNQTSTDLTRNQLAQKLQLKVCALLGVEESVAEAIKHLDSPFCDKEFSKLKQLFEASGIEAIEEAVRGDLARTKVDLISKEQLRDEFQQTFFPEESEPEAADPAEEFIEELAVDPLIISENKSHQRLNFSEIKLRDIFKQRGSLHTSQNQSKTIHSTTLAEIYAKQGHLEKSLQIYRSLLNSNPENDGIKKKLRKLTSEIGRQNQMDELNDLEPEIDQQIEGLGIIDQQIKFYETLLDDLQEPVQP